MFSKLLVSLQLLELDLRLIIILLIPQCKIKMLRLTHLETFRTVSVRSDCCTVVANNSSDIVPYDNQGSCLAHPNHNKLVGQTCNSALHSPISNNAGH